MSFRSVITSSVLPVFLFSLIVCLAAITNANIHNYTFVIERKIITRLCKQRTIITVNRQLPGPTIVVRDGDTVNIKTYNRAGYNATLHWHGVEQLRTSWADGPAYITQCPIPPGGRYIYRFNISGQGGTVWWHAHISWLRATVHGVFVIYPKRGSLYPFPKYRADIPIVIGEWWNDNPIAVIDEAVLTGGPPNLSDAYTLNGQPGDLFPCSSSETFRFPVERGETYLLRIVNAALNTGHFFKIADHKFTVVAVDACYTKPYKTDVIVISAGQTTDVLLTANQSLGKYYMAARPYNNQAAGNFDNSTTTAILEYIGAKNSTLPILPSFPSYNDTETVTKFNRALRSLASQEHPVDVPRIIDESLISTVGLGLLPCETGHTCKGPNGTRLSASMNNVSFVSPTISHQRYNFYVVGDGFGNYNPKTDPLKFNLVDPPQRNTVIAPVSGWVAIRFRANNPGMWFLHCHLDDHFTWGLTMVFLVKNGPSPSTTLGPPPPDLPAC